MPFLLFIETQKIATLYLLICSSFFVHLAARPSGKTDCKVEETFLKELCEGRRAGNMEKHTLTFQVCQLVVYSNQSSKQVLEWTTMEMTD